MGATEDARAVLVQLERVLEEKQTLIERFERLAAGRDGGEAKGQLGERIACLTREQRRLLGLLAGHVPPAEPPESG